MCLVGSCSVMFLIKLLLVFGMKGVKVWLYLLVDCRLFWVCGLGILLVMDVGYKMVLVGVFELVCVVFVIFV